MNMKSKIVKQLTLVDKDGNTYTVDEIDLLPKDIGFSIKNAGCFGSDKFVDTLHRRLVSEKLEVSPYPHGFILNSVDSLDEVTTKKTLEYYLNLRINKIYKKRESTLEENKEREIALAKKEIEEKENSLPYLKANLLKIQISDLFDFLRKADEVFDISHIDIESINPFGVRFVYRRSISLNYELGSVLELDPLEANSVSVGHLVFDIMNVLDIDVGNSLEERLEYFKNYLELINMYLD